ncbi:MAG: hypothetical protein IPK19_30255 [Chloroflexi bacterium]|nr:hypothetical protein [Chloroflexota bacterium]
MGLALLLQHQWQQLQRADHQPVRHCGDPASQTGVVGQSEATLRLRAEPNVLSTQIGRIPWERPAADPEQTGDGWCKGDLAGTVGWGQRFS